MFGVRRTTQARQYVLLMLHVTVTMQASGLPELQPVVLSNQGTQLSIFLYSLSLQCLQPTNLCEPRCIPP